MRDVLYKSHRGQQATKSSQITPEKTKEFHDAALGCIVTDDCPFGDFRRSGMVKFLSVICPGIVSGSIWVSFPS